MLKDLESNLKQKVCQLHQRKPIVSPHLFIMALRNLIQQYSMQENTQVFPFLEEPLRAIYPEYSHKRLLRMLNSQVVDRALGCLFGSFIGDALGSFLEFQKSIPDQLLNHAMRMPAGGTFNLRSGQITDDSQMAFHLLRGLSKFNPNQPIEKQVSLIISGICCEYVSWRKSKPFDIGNTCNSGITQIEKRIKKIIAEPSKLEANIDQLYQAVYAANRNSQSNGSLMRIAPIPFFCALLPKGKDNKDLILNELKKLTQKEIKLIHSNELVVESSLIWSMTLRSIIGRTSNKELKDILKGVLEYANKRGLSSWVDAVNDERPIDGVQNMGWAKIAWSYGFRCLKKIAYLPEGQELGPQLYKQCIREILSRGGDTDTNAAISGGMLGAIIGFKKLPRQYLKTMINLTFPIPANNKTDRPEMYQPKHAFIDAFKMIEMLTKKESKHNLGHL